MVTNENKGDGYMRKRIAYAVLLFFLMALGCFGCISKAVKTETESTEEAVSVEDMVAEEITTEEITVEDVTTDEATTEIVTESVSTEATTEKETEKETEKVATAATEATTQKQTQMSIVETTAQAVQYYDPYTGLPCTKEEYESMWEDIINPKPTEPVTQTENVYVFYDDGTINLKESNLYCVNEELVILIKDCHEIKNLIGTELYSKITRCSLSWMTGSSRPTLFACISSEYWIFMTFDENWNAVKGGCGTLYNPDHLPIKDEW